MATGIYPPDLGGPSTWLSRVIPQLRVWHEVSVVTYGQPRDGAITVRREQALPLRLFKYVLACWKASHNVDRIICTDVFSAGLAAVLVAKARRIPCTVRFVGDAAWEISRSEGWHADDFRTFQNKKYGLRVGLMRFAERFVIRNASRVVTVSQQLGRLALDWGARDVRVVTNHVVPVSVGSSRGFLRETYFGSHCAGQVVVSVGRLVNYKRIDDVIHAVKDVPGWSLFIVGTGPDEARLKSVVAGARNVVFLGWRTPEEVRRVLFAADFLVVASEYEGMSHTLLEALNVGTRVIASDVEGNVEVARQNPAVKTFCLGSVVGLKSTLGVPA